MISEKTKIWLFQSMEDARCDLHEAHWELERQEASETYGRYCEIVSELGLMDEYWKGEWDGNR